MTGPGTSPPDTLFAALSLGELLAVVASEASEHPFVGSDVQKAAWDEIKTRYRIMEIEKSRLVTQVYEAARVIRLAHSVDGWDEWLDVDKDSLLDRCDALTKDFRAEIAAFGGEPS